MSQRNYKIIISWENKMENIKIHYRYYDDFFKQNTTRCGTVAAGNFAVHEKFVTCKRCRNVLDGFRNDNKNINVPCSECGETKVHSISCSNNITMK